MRKTRKILKDQKGFTLTELMIVIVIIGILAAIAVPRFKTVITKAKVVEFQPILAQLYALENNYYSVHDTYSSSLDDIGFDNPKAKYFSFSVEADSNSFTAIATCIANLKGRGGENMNGMKVTINNDEEKGGDMPLRSIAQW